MSNKDMDAMSTQNNEKRALVPPLRFPEFQDAGEWKAEPLRRLAKRCTSKNATGEHTRVLSNSAEYGVIDQRDYFEKDIANQGNLGGYYIVEKGNYVYNPRISTTAPVGPISRNNVGTGIMSPLYTVFRFASSENDFYAHYFKSTHWHHYIRQSSSTGARHDRMSITNDDFMGLPLPVSTPKEQQKIADCLTSLDELITAEIQKLDILKAHKKGLMQQLFPREGETVPRLRFPEFRGEWQKRKLSDLLIKSVSPVNVDANAVYQEIGIRSHGKGIFHKEPVSGKALGEKRVFWVEENAFVVNIVFAWEQAVAVTSVEDEGMIASHRFPMYKAKQNKTNVKFIKYLFLTKKGKELLWIASPGGAGRNKTLGQKEFENLEPLFTDKIEEQTEIARFLASLDELISTQAQRIDALRTHKRGLMQQLFPELNEVEG